MTNVSGAYMIELIERLSADDSLQTYQRLQAELLRRVQRDGVLMSEDAWNENEAKEDSVFARVDQHWEDGENKLDLYAEQFQKVHGIDHKPFTERWLLEQTGHYVELEKVLEKPSFHDLAGVYDIQPMTAYVASKMIIDDADIMGVFDLGKNPSKRKGIRRQGTYQGVAEDNSSMGNEQYTALTQDASARKLEQNVWQQRAVVNPGKQVFPPLAKRRQADAGMQQNNRAPMASTKAICCSTQQVAAHALGQGQFLQFKLRQENVMQYLDNSIIASKLKNLIPDDPKEPIYVFTASENGVMRFHPWGGIQRKLWHGYGDSEQVEAFPINIAHAGKYGCFCFGVIYKERENYADRSGQVQRGGRTIVMRYNRWATDNEPIYAMVRQRADERDISVPTQPSQKEHYERLVGNRVTGIQNNVTGLLSRLLSEATDKSPKE